LRLLLHSSSQDDIQYVGRTIESFKLADLYWLEACVRAYCQQNSTQADVGHQPIRPQPTTELVKRLAFHRPTASYLLGYTEQTTQDAQSLPFRPNKCQYVGEVIAKGTTPNEFIGSISQFVGNTSSSYNSTWTLDYDIFEPLRHDLYLKKDFTSTMLMCAASRVLPGEPSLSSIHAERNVAYIIVETSTELYLVRKHNTVEIDNGNITKDFRTSWSQRPFQYSGAINLDVALTILDIITDILQSRITSRTLRMLDPTCGSGTFLGLALMLWNSQVEIELTGVDSNSKCASGTVKNLMKLLSLDGDAAQCTESTDMWTLTLRSDSKQSAKATIHTGDSVMLLPTIATKKYDCAVANLPWNRNTFEYQSKNSACASSDIMKATAAVLKPGAPLIVVSGGDDASFDANQCLRHLGFDVLGEATVPPRGFNLPSSGKKKRGNTENNVGSRDKVARSSDCIITVAIAPI
jgi:hypothetical protein